MLWHPEPTGMDVAKGDEYTTFAVRLDAECSEAAVPAPKREPRTWRAVAGDNCSWNDSMRWLRGARAGLAPPGSPAPLFETRRRSQNGFLDDK
jgi:hypothetical protein